MFHAFSNTQKVVRARKKNSAKTQGGAIREFIRKRHRHHKGVLSPFSCQKVENFHE